MVNSVGRFEGYGLEKNITEKYDRLRTVHQLQKNFVVQNMHNAMSPISAISGYLELMNISLHQGRDVQQIERYREKIERGINEVSAVLEQLHHTFSDRNEETAEDAVSIDLNEIVRRVCGKMQHSNSKLVFASSIRPLYVYSDPFLTKLIISNLINNSKKCALNDEPIEVKMMKEQETATVCLRFRTTDKRGQELKDLLGNSGHFDEVAEPDRLNTFSRGLLTSDRLARQINGKINLVEDAEGLVQVFFTLPVPV